MNKQSIINILMEEIGTADDTEQEDLAFYGKIADRIIKEA